jgi:hypothetical protein
VWAPASGTARLPSAFHHEDTKDTKRESLKATATNYHTKQQQRKQQQRNNNKETAMQGGLR